MDRSIPDKFGLGMAEVRTLNSCLAPLCESVSQFYLIFLPVPPKCQETNESTEREVSVWL